MKDDEPGLAAPRLFDDPEGPTLMYRLQAPDEPKLESLLVLLFPPGAQRVKQASRNGPGRDHHHWCADEHVVVSRDWLRS